MYLAKDCILPADDVVQRWTHVKVLLLGVPKQTGDCLAVRPIFWLSRCAALFSQIFRFATADGTVCLINAASNGSLSFHLMRDVCVDSQLNDDGQQLSTTRAPVPLFPPQILETFPGVSPS